MNRSQTNLLIFTVVAINSLHAAAAADDQLLRDPGMLAGPWEGKSGENLVGVYLRIDTALKGSVEYLSELSVRVDRVVDRDWGWFKVDGRIATWDGVRLKLNYNETTIDLVFDPKQRAWIGTFGSNRTVRLERPANSEIQASSFIGTWKSEVAVATPGCLHVAVRRNGTPVIWLDRRFGRRYGELLENPSITDGRISFSLFVYTYTGTLVDGQRIEGTWRNQLQAPYTLMRSSESACASLPINSVASSSPFLVPPPARNQQP